MNGKKQQNLDDLDRQILNRVQKSVPLARRPFRVLANEMGTTEDEIIDRMRRMWDEGVIRRLGPILDYSSWGMSGLLVAAKSSDEQVSLAEEVLGAYPEITHAYLRKHEWNLWFTVIAENEAARKAIIAEVTRRAHLTDVKELPMERTFKLGVKFEL
ncbi:MAG: Lrp/AsnC family transcriptional regulator [Proteobacteria bacterium]|nr:Lrp/AsnC family transcriptional regulator [Pseudomonadota bacterium]